MALASFHGCNLHSSADCKIALPYCTESKSCSRRASSSQSVPVLCNGFHFAERTQERPRHVMSRSRMCPAIESSARVHHRGGSGPNLENQGSEIIAAKWCERSSDWSLSRREGIGALTAVGLQLTVDNLFRQDAHAAIDESPGGELESKRKASGGRERERVEFKGLENGVQALDIREGTGAVPQEGDKVAVHYYARLAAKQGWRFDSTYDHKGADGDPEPFEFVVGSPSVISGLSTAVKSMRVGGTRRVVIPPTQGYQSMTDEPVPPNFFDRQRLFTTIFNPTRIQNGEGATLGTLVFDIQLLGIRQSPQ